MLSLRLPGSTLFSSLSVLSCYLSWHAARLRKAAMATRSVLRHSRCCRAWTRKPYSSSMRRRLDTEKSKRCERVRYPGSDRTEHLAEEPLWVPVVDFAAHDLEKALRRDLKIFTRCTIMRWRITTRATFPMTSRTCGKLFHFSTGAESIRNRRGRTWAGDGRI